MWIGAGQHFSFMNQPQAAGKNFKQFGAHEHRLQRSLSSAAS